MPSATLPGQQARAEASESFQNARADEAAAQAAAELSSEESAAACEKARDQLKSYINARRLYRQDEDGNPVYLSSAEIDQARADAEQRVADHCG